MNYDDVLEFIQKDINDAAFKRNEYYPSRSLLALKAVVELHKPETGWSDGVEVENHHCSCDPYNEYDMGYPCETIQVIKEQLK